MQIFEIIKTIADYGITLVLSGLVIYAAIRLINIGLNRVESKFSRKSHDEALNLRSEIDEQVYDLINDFIADHNGTRLQVIEFTNTVTSVAYLPFRYMSCTYEVVTYGHRPKALLIDKLSTSLFSPFLSPLSRSTYLKLDEQASADLSGTVHDLFVQIGCKYMLSVILKSEKSKCIGYVSFYKETDVQEKDIEDLIKLGNDLSVLLGVLDK